MWGSGDSGGGGGVQVWAGVSQKARWQVGCSGGGGGGNGVNVGMGVVREQRAKR